MLVGTVVLAADGAASLNGTENGNTLIFGSPSSVSPFVGSGGGGGTSTWTYVDGAVTIPGLTTLSVSAGGRVLIFAGANPSDGANVLLILTRLQ